MSNELLTKVQLLNAKEMAAILNVSQRHLWRMKSAGKLPKPVKLGNCTRWLLNDIEAWLRWNCPLQKKFEAMKKTNKSY